MRRGKAVKVAATVVAVGIATWAGVVIAQGRLNTHGNPNFGTRSIAPGFMPDPMNVTITSGGSLDVSAMGLGAGCTGWATSQPDFRFNLTGRSSNLRLYVTSNTDTTLVVNKANNQWVCNDDSYGGTNPTIDLGQAPPGQYDVWVGSYQQGQQANAVLHITEISSNHP